MSEATADGRRKIGLWTCTSLVMGNMIGSGIFLLPSALAAYGGISIFGWLFTTAGALLVALVFARMSRIVPGAGGPYAYTRRGFGEFAGFLVAWGYWISIMAGNAAIAVALVSYLTEFLPALSGNPALAAGTAIACLWALTWVNCQGVRNAGYVQIVTTVLKILPLLLIGCVGLFHFDSSNFLPLNVSGESNFSALTATAALTLWAFMGLESATIPADDVDNPKQTIAKATVLGVLAASVIYILSTVAVMGLIPTSGLAESEAPFAEAASAIWGSGAGKLVALGAVVSCFGALNGWTLNQGQIPMAAARDRLFPEKFAQTSKNGAPVFALIVSSVLVTILISSNYTRGLVALFTFTILLSTITALVPYAFTAMSELMVYITERESFRGEKLAAASVIAVLAFAYSLWAISGAGKDEVFWGFLLVLAGIPVYVLMKWHQARLAEQM